MCKLNPRIDFVFKKLFGSEENKDILKSFVNAFLSEDQQAEYLELKNPFNLANYKEQKNSILDIKARDEKGRWYDIEIQVSPQTSYAKRALYYWGKVYTDQLGKGMVYSELNKTIGINILNFKFFDYPDYHSKFKLINTKNHVEYPDLLEIHFIELEKFGKDLKEISTTLERWVAFLQGVHHYDKAHIPVELGRDEYVTKAIIQLDEMSMTEEEREIYDGQLKFHMDRIEEINTARETGFEEGIEKGKEEGRKEGKEEGRKEGKEEGRKEGKEEGRVEGREEGEKRKAYEIARNLLDVLDIETISLKTGLTKNELLILKTEKS